MDDVIKRACSAMYSYGKSVCLSILSSVMFEYLDISSDEFLVQLLQNFLDSNYVKHKVL